MCFRVNIGSYEAPSGRELAPAVSHKVASAVTEGECVTVTSVHIQAHEGSFHHFVVPLPADASLTA